MITAYDPSAHPDEQAYQALTYADKHGWAIFEHITAGKPSERRHVVTATPLTPPDPDHMPVTRHLPTAAVLPWVRALADVRGMGHLFPDREDTATP